MTTNTTPARGRGLSRGIRTAWALVLAMLLAAAAWSLSGQLGRWGMPTWLAASLSVMFDAAGLICATYARRAVERGTPAGLSRTAILLFVGIAGLLNWHHGHTIGGQPAAWGFASLSAGVELLFELHRRDVRDEQRAARGLIPERMPHVPALGWIMYPGRSWTTVRAAVGARLDLLDPVQASRTLTPPPDTTSPDTRTDATVRAAVRAAASVSAGSTPDDIVAQLSAAGIETDADTVRSVLDQSKNGVGTPPVHPITPPGQSIADTIRTALASGITGDDTVLRYVRGVHGENVSADTVARTRRRIEKPGRAAS
ncbi:DUF2637 domain-containing protein [Streptomyces sulphureus]|uniref:DUF2637 domain-containing protein n=1 Tax=Streptomyces sulphureus TaxID=47758 RepID=UPI0003663C16|nr:DUF2637 domain-containing protein [Streptomyces sulphureus]